MNGQRVKTMNHQPLTLQKNLDDGNGSDIFREPTESTKEDNAQPEPTAMKARASQNCLEEDH